jgi:hypothetical protein
MIAWALAGEFTHDLKRPPKDAILTRLARLPQGLVQASGKLAAHLRATHPEVYARAADEFEDRLENELREATAEDFGQIDTFRFEDQKIFEAALASIEAERWADAQAVAFNAICRSDGFLPDLGLCQRTIFDEVVRPAVEAGGPVAYFVVDALRFEMAAALAGLLGKESGAKLELRPRYAELPTLTEVGMNALAPVNRAGRLGLELAGDSILGFRVGEVRVSTPKSRQKTMHERVGGETCPWIALEDLLERDPASLRQAIGRARLAVVHAEGIDKSGEKGVGLDHFENELHRLRAAWLRLRDAGVQRFVVTADHGFLLQDETTRVPLAHGKKTDVGRRHVITRHPADHAGTVRVPAKELQYDAEDVHFVFPENTMPFDVGDKAKAFVHGGNSLQERIIPVLTATYRHAKGATTVRYKATGFAEDPVGGLHRIRATLRIASQHELVFGGKREVELQLVALDGTDVAVDLVEADGARIAGGALVAPLETPFWVAFRLRGNEALRSRVALRGALGGDDVIALELERRFSVEVVPGLAPAVTSASSKPGTAWLDALPEGGVREVFAHILEFGGINEVDATRMLGGGRPFRKFSREFERHASLAPFEVRIDASSGQKRYVREGMKDAE